jgi:hypothetical protein
MRVYQFRHLGDLLITYVRTFLFVPRTGVEPARPCGHWSLKPARLPIPPSGRLRLQIYALFILSQEIFINFPEIIPLNNCMFYFCYVFLPLDLLTKNE